MADKDHWSAPESESAQPPKKKGMSGCMIALLVACGLGFITAVVCIGIGAWFAMNFIPKISKEPADVTATTKKILDIEIPATFSPDLSMNMDNNSFVTFRMVAYKHSKDEGTLILAGVTPKIKDNNQNAAEDQSRQFREPFEKPIRDRIEVTKTDTHKITIDGNPDDLMIGEGTDRDSKKPAHMASLAFKSGESYITFLIWMDDDEWDQDGLIHILESAKVPANQ